jgi:exopolyphosphatase/guanosine-5'-triphosphate,3'-diphosphate pyrophosphatase
MQRVAVVDLGSNSLKLLVADGPPMTEVARARAEVRIFPTDGAALAPEAILAATDAVADLVARARAAGSERVLILGTSALRDAPNRALLAAALRDRTNLDLSVISGETEARLGVEGILADPALAGVRDCIAFDLGGGSMQVMRVIGRRCAHARSLPLGAARMTRGFLGDIAKPLDAHDLESLRHHALGLIQPQLPAGSAREAPLVGAGGALAAVCDLMQAAGEPAAGGRISVLAVRHWLARLAALDLAGRRAVPGMPEGRADILPAALVVVLALADHVGAESLQMTHNGVRHGMARLLLAEGGEILTT